MHSPSSITTLILNIIFIMFWDVKCEMQMIMVCLPIPSLLRGSRVWIMSWKMLFLINELCREAQLPSLCSLGLAWINATTAKCYEDANSEHVPKPPPKYTDGEKTRDERHSPSACSHHQVNLSEGETDKNTCQDSLRRTHSRTTVCTKCSRILEAINTIL